MLARSGPVSVVKQLAQDLAQRDAQITALRRKAEERERILRKMLQECEVSNLDIDERLKLLERGPTPNGAGDAGDRGRKAKRQSLVDVDSVHPEDPIDKHLARAMSDENDGDRELMQEDDASLTAFPALSDDHSVNSADLATTKSSKTWKSYIWTGSLANKRRSQTPSVTSANIGPVEMDMILPEETRPPTLMPHNYYGRDSEFLTDSFGDEEIPAEQLEEAFTLPRSESVLSQTDDIQSATKRSWQDYLKIATFPTELLSHTPVAAPMTTVDIEETPRAPQVTVQNNASFPAVRSNPEPALSVESGAAEISQPAISGPASPISGDFSSPQPDPVKALLDQLTDLHDSLQRDKQVRWHEFLRKVRAERKREGDAVAASEGRGKNTMPETLLTDGEIIGTAGLGNKGKIGRAKWKEFKNLVLGGIPVSYRAKIWAECSGAAAMRIPGYYEDLVANGTDDPVVVSQIQMDIHRTLTDNIFFRRGPGVQKLNEVLIAYARRNHAVGYCQGMNLITACLLLIMPTAEDAFWMLATMIETILPESYYDHSLLASRADQIVLRQYVAELLPKLSAHFDELSIELEALTFQWFLSVFTDCLSAEALYRVWDVVLCMHDGSTFLFQVALALLKLNEKALIECDNPGAVYHYINQQMTNHAISIDGLIQASEALKNVVRRKDVEDRRTKAIEHEREVTRQREELRAERLNKLKEGPTAAESGGESSSSYGSAPPPPQLVVQSATNEYPDDDVVANMSPPEPTTPTTMTSSVSYSSSRDDEEQHVHPLPEELERSLTPMPIDEEVMWRA
ncbi:putative run and tbc1 domain containing protein [Diplodia seriata]|uniref:Putative run and tbc1 domain containing protein n=1 Tax=Diplodia seriata TaxID=420778 RepID=A0A0G2EPH4_9PEZI|nr:putative run and tbc1 domain containing protein [Diplodia seriata]